MGLLELLFNNMRYRILIQTQVLQQPDPQLRWTFVLRERIHFQKLPCKILSCQRKLGKLVILGILLQDVRIGLANQEQAL